MTIYKPDGTAFIDIEVDDESYHYAEIMGRDDITLYFSLPHFIDFPIGCYIYYATNNTNYTLYSVDKMRMEHRREYEYTITFESVAAELGAYILTLLSAKPDNLWNWHGTQEGDFKFPFAASSQQHLQLIASCMTFKTGQTWSVGSYVDGGEKLISYDTMTCLDALKQVAQAFETEYSIVGRTINLGKVEQFKSDQLTISYGKGNGLRPGIERTVDGSEMAIGKVYIQGGDRNIDPSKYGHPTLRLPKSTYEDLTTHQLIDRYWWYDGTTVSATQFEGAKRFSCPTGSYIALAENNAPIGEGALDLSEVYPHFEHYIEGVEEEDRDKHWWNIYTDEFTAEHSTVNAINYDECLIKNGEQLSVIFQDGQLAGRQFGVEWATKDDPDHEGETIAYMKIVPSEQDGIEMPNHNGFAPETGRHFIVINCYLPGTYIERAEMEMLEKALAYLWERMTPSFSIKGEVDPIWSASRWNNIGSHFVPGAYFNFIDPVWEGSGVSIRVSNVKTFINKPHQPIVEMMSGISRPGVATVIQKLKADSRVVPESYNYTGRSFTKRSFADAKETMEMLINAGLEGFDASISPITVQTMQLLVGSEQLQFLFFEESTCVTQISHPYNYNPTTKKLVYTACYLQHQTLGVADIRAKSDTRTNLREWSISSGESAVLDDPEMAYYHYVKCEAPNDGTVIKNGQFWLEDKNHQHEMGPVTETEGGVDKQYYYFLAAIINAEREGARSDAPLFGFTEVLPGQITTDVIRGTAGTTFWDLVQNEFRIGNASGTGPLLHWLNGNLRLRGALVVSGNGTTTSQIGCWRGEYLAGNSYYPGDEVWYEYPTNSGLISTYRCTSYATSGVAPTNTNYWEVLARGVEGNGIDGVPVDTFWKETTLNGTTPPSGSESDWKSTRPTGTNLRKGEFVWKRTKTIYTNGDIYYTYTSEYYADDGDNGDPGPWLNTRGNWSNLAKYSGSSESCDVVLNHKDSSYNPYGDEKWYRTKSDAGNFGPSNTPPHQDTTHWEAFESNFSNVATGLLYTTRAYVDNLYVKDLETAHTANGYIKSIDNYLLMVDYNGKKKLYITGNNIPDIVDNNNGGTTINAKSITASSGVASGTTNTASFSITNEDNQVVLPNVDIDIIRSSGYNSSLEVLVEYVLDGETVSSLVVEGTPLGRYDTSLTYRLPGTSIILPYNTGSGADNSHEIFIRLYAMTDDISLSSIYSYSASVVIYYKTENVTIGANGLRAAWASDCYAEFVKTNNNVVFTMRNGTVGLRLTSSAIQKWNNSNSTWEAASL